MQKDTVLLSLEKYNELRDFQREIKKGKIAVIKKWWGFGNGNETIFYTEDEIVKEFEREIKTLKEEVKILKETKKESDEPKVITIEEVKKMMWQQFRKWKMK